MLSVTIILVIAALIAVIVSALGKCPLWVAVLLLTVAVALLVLPAK